MIRRTLYFGNPAYLSMRMKQLVIRKAEEDKSNDSRTETEIKTVPIEDLGFIILDNRQITITNGLMEALMENNVAVITCDSTHLPLGLMLPLSGNTVQSERYSAQISASLPLKKQLWQQTVQCKIRNQAYVLKYATGQAANNMLIWANNVKSGDTENLEGRAAAFYWKSVFVDNPRFVRGGDDMVNIMLNYGYSIIRAMIARALVGAGLLPTLGIHHHNRYDAYCLADDIMEPYRPYVDKLVLDFIGGYGTPDKLNTDVKRKLLEIPVAEVEMDGIRRPMMVAANCTATSLRKCFEGSSRKLVYPEME